ncbi:hypothetical protein, partial [Streptomyces sp. URMC 123]|uniref:hypothetical protein n=1 Tax=Streptomyces sp. URMC 123 TaxID=3423403 RepID=UPI003F1BC7E2
MSRSAPAPAPAPVSRERLASEGLPGERLSGEDRARRLLLWSGRDTADEARVRHELAAMLDALPPDAVAALPAVLPCGTAPGPVRGAVVTDTPWTRAAAAVSIPRR